MSDRWELCERYPKVIFIGCFVIVSILVLPQVFHVIASSFGKAEDAKADDSDDETETDTKALRDRVKYLEDEVATLQETVASLSSLQETVERLKTELRERKRFY